MKPSLMMKQVVQQLAERYGLDLSRRDSFLRLDMPNYDSLVVAVIGPSQIAVTCCFEEGAGWKIDREVILFTPPGGDWLPIEITQLETGWHACAKLDSAGERIVQINQCDQARLAEFTERWARRLSQQNWLEQGVLYRPWTPPWRKEE